MAYLRIKVQHCKIIQIERPNTKVQDMHV